MKPMYKEITDVKEEDVVDDPKERTKQGDDIVYNYKKRKIELTDFDKKNRKRKEKYKVTKKKNQGDEIITSLSSKETNNRNNIKKK